MLVKRLIMTSEALISRTDHRTVRVHPRCVSLSAGPHVSIRSQRRRGLSGRGGRLVRKLVLKLEETVEAKADAKNDQEAADANPHANGIGSQRQQDHQAEPNGHQGNSGAAMT